MEGIKAQEHSYHLKEFISEVEMYMILEFPINFEIMMQ